MGKDLIELLCKKDAASAKGAAKECFTSGGGRAELIKQFYLYAAHHVEKRFPTPHGVIFVDTFRDLLKLYPDGEAPFLIDKAVEYLCTKDVAPFEPELHLAARGKAFSNCLFEYLEAAIRMGDKAKSIDLASRFLNSDRSFKELLAGLLRIASSHETPLGHTLILTNSALKGAKSLGASDALEMVCHIAGYLASRRPIAAERYKGAELLDFKSAYAKASLNIGLLGHHVIYLGHARGAFEGATNTIIKENLLNVISRKFAAKELVIDGTNFSGQSVSSFGEEKLLEAIVRGDHRRAIGIADRLIALVENSSAAFRPMVRGICEKAPADQSHYLIFTNSCLRAFNYLGPEAGRPFMAHAIRNACDTGYILGRLWS